MGGFRYTVLGAGRQGVAIAYDLAVHGEAAEVLLADVDQALVTSAVQRLNLLVGRPVAKAATCNATSEKELIQAIHGSTGVVSALPYFLNPQAAEVSLREKAHFCDLGGNTDIVMRELELDREARNAGVSILPDSGLAPGLSNLLAADALRKLQSVRQIRALCGGLPVVPRPPFFYKLVFSLEGLINEYSGDAIYLRDGKVVKVPALTELETIDIPGEGRFEAFVTTGGTSTAPYTFQGRVENFDYKTLRHPGHFQAIRAFADLGLFSTSAQPVGGASVTPRKVLIELLKEKIDFPSDRDLVILLVFAEGMKDGRRAQWRALLVDRGDSKGHFTAMERTTGFPTAVIAHLQATGRMPAGAIPPERAVPLDLFREGIRKRGIEIKETLNVQ